jgi:hypothetical protein
LPITFGRILKVVLFILLVGLFPLIALWKANLGQLPASVVLMPSLVTIVIILIIYGIWLAITRSFEKAALLTGVFSVFALTFGHVYNLVAQKMIFGISIGFMKLLLVYLILFITISVVLLKIGINNYSFLLYADILAGILICFNLVPIIFFYIQSSQGDSTHVTTNSNKSEGTTKSDIYYIVLDSYARDDVLSEVIGYDNSDFLIALRERGFFIPKCPYSNYDNTMDTIASVLNAQYLDALGISLKSLDVATGTKTNLILHSKIFQDFKNFGYEIVTGRGFTSSLDILTSDIYLNYKKNQGIYDELAQQQFNGLYADTTILRVLTELSRDNAEAYSWIPYWLAGNRENNVELNQAIFWFNQNNYMFDSLEKIPRTPGNYFVYAHIIAPHFPFVYRADGSFNYPPDSNDLKILNAEMITYINKQVLELVDVLQKKSSIPPIIIIQADHGLHVLTTGMDLHKILSAYYLPGTVSTRPYDTITPVNDFRLLLKDYFDPTMNLLPDTLWVKFTNDYEPVPASCDIQP